MITSPTTTRTESRSANLMLDTVLTPQSRKRQMRAISSEPVIRILTPPPQPRKTKIGLVLSGGLARGIAHIGVLQVFADAGIEVDRVAATSAGALMGLMYCAGISPRQMAEIIRTELLPRKQRRWLPGSATWHLAGLLKSGGLRECVSRHVPETARLEDLSVPLAVTSTDLVAGEPVVHRTGAALQAVMASLAYPGLAPTVEIDGRTLIDGGVLNNMPGNLLANAGMDFVIGVDLASPCKVVAPKLGSMRIVLRSMHVRRRAAPSQQGQWIDVMIRPDVASFSRFDISEYEGLIAAGASAAQSALPAILERSATVNCH